MQRCLAPRPIGETKQRQRLHAALVWSRRTLCCMSWALQALLVVGLGVTLVIAADAKAQTPQLLPNLQLLQELERPATTTSVMWSSDGSKLAAYTVTPAGSISGRLLTIWNADGQVLREIEPPEAFFFGADPLAFVAGDKEIVTTPWLNSNKLAFLVFEVESGALVREIEGPRPDGYRQDNGAMALAASPDEAVVAVVFGFNRPQAVGLYSTRDWSKLATLEETAAGLPRLVAFSPDGKYLAVAELVGGKVLIYDLTSRHVVQTLDPFPEPGLGVLSTMAFSPDGSLIAFGIAREVEVAVDAPVRVFHLKDGSSAASYPQPVSPISEVDPFRGTLGPVS
jgi:WD40 repeat protein